MESEFAFEELVEHDWVDNTTHGCSCGNDTHDERAFLLEVVSDDSERRKIQKTLRQAETDSLSQEELCTFILRNPFYESCAENSVPDTNGLPALSKS